jgi:hypothetical protein
MATLLELTQEIEDEISKGGLNLLTTQIQQAINDSIAYYEVYQFRFNQGFDNSINTVAATEAYTLPADVIVVNRAQIAYSASDLQQLEIKSWTEYQLWREGYSITQGQSDFCMFYNDEIYLYPTPNGVYNIKLWYLKRLANVPLTANSQTNAWTTRARMLIKSRAKYLLAVHRIDNAEWATIFAQEEASQLISLQTEMNRQSAPRELLPEYF